MKLAVLSGKGGAGKTFVAVNLAAAAEKAVYIDCDADAPNGRLFLKSDKTEKEDVSVMLPRFDAEKCISCRKCAEFCRFNAIVCVKKGAPILFEEICHPCGGCALVCPAGAISEFEKTVGTVERSVRGNVEVVTAEMAVGEASAMPVIKRAMSYAAPDDRLTIIDCPPGSGCPVLECVQFSDVCLLVAEPTAFGLHNLKLVCELTKVIGRPGAVVINKTSGRYAPLEEFCRENNMPVLARIPYTHELASLGARSDLAVEASEEYRALFSGLLADAAEVAGL